jgi:hypothetical protein
VREIRMLRATWRGLETWHGREACRRASPRPYLGGGREVTRVPTAKLAIAAVHESLVGTNRTTGDVHLRSAFGRRAEVGLRGRDGLVDPNPTWRNCLPRMTAD